MMLNRYRARAMLFRPLRAKDRKCPNSIGFQPVFFVVFQVAARSFELLLDRPAPPLFRPGKKRSYGL
jgi:hypothetical protein